MTEQEKIRREKLEELKRLGINPYPAKLFPVDSFSVDLILKKRLKEELLYSDSPKPFLLF